MKISELAATTRTTLPTLKFYLREGLLMPGVSVSRTRAEYGDEHVERVRLLQTLSQLPGFSYPLLKEIFGLVTDERLSLGDRVERALQHLPPGAGEPRDIAPLREVGAALGFAVRDGSAAAAQLATALDAAEAVGMGCSTEQLRGYWEHMRDVAAFEVAGMQSRPDDASAAQYAVVGTAIFEPVILALRRMAHEELFKGRLGGDGSGDEGDRPPPGRSAT